MELSVEEAIRKRIGLPDEAKTLSSTEFYGYFYTDEENMRKIWAPDREGIYSTRQTFPISRT